MAIINIGIIGLGRIGGAVLHRLHAAGHSVVGFDVNKTTCQTFKSQGINCVDSLTQLAQTARIIFMYVPAGTIVDQTLEGLLPYLQPNDIIVDGGNSKFTDSIARAKELAEHNIEFLDCGTSGGIHGQQIGFSLMVGGNQSAYDRIHPILLAMATPGGVGYMGPSGTGHYVKMVHNGIEYALLQAYAEGLELLKEGTFKKAHLDLEEITRVWMHGSIIRSWILELLHEIVAKNKNIDAISGRVAESGTGAWTVEDAQKNNVPLPIIKEALAIRAQSRETGGTYATKLVALLRLAFGGHPVEQIRQKEQK